MFSSLYDFVLNSVTGAFTACLRPQFNNSLELCNDEDLENKELPSPITKALNISAKSRNAYNTSKKRTLHDMWSRVDNGTTDSILLPQDIPPTNKNKVKNVIAKSKNNALAIPKSPADLKSLLLSKYHDGYVSLKVLCPYEGEPVIKEFIVETIEFQKALRKIKKFKTLFHSCQGKYKEVPFTAKACIILFQFLFCERFFLPNLDAAIETHSLAKKIHAKKLLNHCFIFIEDQRYSSKIDSVIVELNELNNTLISTFMPNFVQENCFIAYSFTSSYSSPNVCFPLYPVDQTLYNAFYKDITNTITFESIDGFYFIEGLEIRLNTEIDDCELPLNIIYKVVGDSFSVEKELKEHMKPLISINLNEDDILSDLPCYFNSSGSIIELSITIEDLKPTLCFQFLDTQYIQKTYKGEFSVGLYSSRKTASNVNLFFIEKIRLHNLSANISELTSRINFFHNS